MKTALEETQVISTFVIEFIGIDRCEENVWPLTFNVGK